MSDIAYQKPRLFKVEYTATRRPGYRKRKAMVIVKIPYGGSFAMAEVLMRMVNVGEIERFKVSLPTTEEINGWRNALMRWLPALTMTSEWTGVDWTK